jgi:hypothetical protein
VSHIAINMPGVEIAAIPINKRVEPGQVVTLDLLAKSEGSVSARMPSMTLINHASRAEWMRAIAAVSAESDSNCVKPIIFSEDDSGYQVYAEADRKDPHEMPELIVSASLHFYDFEKQRPGEARLNVHGLLFVRRDCINRLGLETLGRVTPH